MPARPAASVRTRRRAARRHDLERDTPLVALAAARQVVEEAARWLDEAMPADEAARLAARARLAYARSASFRRALSRRADDADRETLYAFLRHWLAARLHAEEPANFARLPAGYAWGGVEPPPGRAPAPAAGPLSPDARLLLAC